MNIIWKLIWIIWNRESKAKFATNTKKGRSFLVMNSIARLNSHRDRWLANNTDRWLLCVVEAKFSTELGVVGRPWNPQVGSNTSFLVPWNDHYFSRFDQLLCMLALFGEHNGRFKNFKKVKKNRWRNFSTNPLYITFFFTFLKHSIF